MSNRVVARRRASRNEPIRNERLVSFVYIVRLGFRWKKNEVRFFVRYKVWFLTSFHDDDDDDDDDDEDGRR